MYRASLRFSDGAAREIAVPAGVSVLRAARDSGIALASQCEVGTCCTCAARLLRGEAVMPQGLVTALTRAEVQAGHRLLCQAVPACDTVFEMGYPSTLLDANPLVEFTAKIARLTWLSSSVAELAVKVPRTAGLRFTAGQYCRIKVPGTQERRSYSIASGEHERTRLRFLIKARPAGLMSKFLRDEARAGMTLEMDGPLGAFVLQDAPRPHLLIAGGTGLAPMLSMLDRIRLMRPVPPVLVAFGCSTYADLFGADELEARTSYMQTLDVRVCVSREPARPGHCPVNPVRSLGPQDVRADTVAYVCGPHGMVSAAQQRLAELGLPPGSVRAESFLPSDN